MFGCLVMLTELFSFALHVLTTINPRSRFLFSNQILITVRSITFQNAFTGHLRLAAFIEYFLAIWSTTSTPGFGFVTKRNRHLFLYSVIFWRNL